MTWTVAIIIVKIKKNRSSKIILKVFFYKFYKYFRFYSSFSKKIEKKDRIEREREREREREERLT